MTYLAKRSICGVLAAVMLAGCGFGYLYWLHVGFGPAVRNTRFASNNIVAGLVSVSIGDSAEHLVSSWGLPLACAGEDEYLTEFGKSEFLRFIRAEPGVVLLFYSEPIRENFDNYINVIVALENSRIVNLQIDHWYEGFFD